MQQSNQNWPYNVNQFVNPYFDAYGKFLNNFFNFDSKLTAQPEQNNLIEKQVNLLLQNAHYTLEYMKEMVFFLEENFVNNPLRRNSRSAFHSSHESHEPHSSSTPTTHKNSKIKKKSSSVKNAKSSSSSKVTSSAKKALATKKATAAKKISSAKLASSSVKANASSALKKASPVKKTNAIKKVSKPVVGKSTFGNGNKQGKISTPNSASFKPGSPTPSSTTTSASTKKSDHTYSLGERSKGSVPDNKPFQSGIKPSSPFDKKF